MNPELAAIVRDLADVSDPTRHFQMGEGVQCVLCLATTDTCSYGADDADGEWQEPAQTCDELVEHRTWCPWVQARKAVDEVPIRILTGVQSEGADFAGEEFGPEEYSEPVKPWKPRTEMYCWGGCQRSYPYPSSFPNTAQAYCYACAAVRDEKHRLAMRSFREKLRDWWQQRRAEVQP